jgi:hypothetical protein
MASRIVVVLPFSEELLMPALREVYEFNCSFLAANPTFPRLYDLAAQGKMRFEREPRRCTDTACDEERFCTIPITVDQGWGDCDDLAPWLAAERTVRDGILSIPVPMRSAVGYHIVVMRFDGVTEDPSLLLGMR